MRDAVIRRISRGTLLALALSVAACGGGNDPNAGGGTTLVMARVKDAVVLDPAHATDGLSLNTTNEVMQNIVTFKPGSFEVVGDAAETWSSSADGKTWTFDLKPGLVFSDGTPLDAKAVKFNLDRWRLASSPAHGNFTYSYYADDFGGFPGAISGVQATSATRVVITLAKPLGPFLRDIAEQAFGLGSPQAILADPKAFELKPVGSGPYQVEEWVRDDHITLVANPKWHGRAPGYRTVIIRDIPDQATSVLSIQKGDIDMLTDPRPDDAKALAAPDRDQRRAAALEQRELHRDGRREEALRRRTRAAGSRLRDRRRYDGEEPVLERCGRRRQLDAAGDARREPGGEDLSARPGESARAARRRRIPARLRDDAELLDRSAPVPARAAARRRRRFRPTSRSPESR